MNASNTPTAACWASGGHGERAQQHASRRDQQQEQQAEQREIEGRAPQRPGPARGERDRRDDAAPARHPDPTRRPTRGCGRVATCRRRSGWRPRRRGCAIAAERRGGIRAASVGFALARALRRTTPKSGIESSRLRPPFESAPACAWRAVARTMLWKASEETTPWAVDSRSGRTATRSGFSRRTAPVSSSATYAETRRSSRLPASRSANVSLSNRPRRTIARRRSSRSQHDPDHRQRPRDCRAGPTVPRSRRTRRRRRRRAATSLFEATQRRAPATVRIDCRARPRPARRAGSTGRPARSDRAEVRVMSTEARPRKPARAG